MSNPFQSDSELESEYSFDDATSAKYPKLETLCGRLLLLKVVKIDENAMKYEAKTPDETQPKAYVDVVVLSGPPIDDAEVPIEYHEMWFSSTPLVDSLRYSFRNGTEVLGTLRRFPSKKLREKFPTQYTTPDEVEQGVREGNVREFMTCWKLAPKTAEDIKIAIKYKKSKESNPFS